MEFIKLFNFFKKKLDSKGLKIWLIMDTVLTAVPNY